VRQSTSAPTTGAGRPPTRDQAPSGGGGGQGGHGTTAARQDEGSTSGTHDQGPPQVGTEGWGGDGDRSFRPS